MKTVSGKKFIIILGNNGWNLLRIKGSHHILGKPGSKIRISIPVHGKKPLKTGLLKYYLKVTGISENDL
ncbi:MAG: hypothetical protein B6D61_06920 [Bacteroidetes bacterium 4484_249]|nr:MAG: hypothetical protein B6D61_06920 [Bacteroidetes bacterium 4484_249]